MTAAPNNQPFDERAARGTILGTARKYTTQIQKLAPYRVDAEHYIEQLRLYLVDKPKLVRCNPVSIARSLLRVAETGLVLGFSCDIVPYAGSCTFIARYNGIINLALAAGTRSINCDVVREGDEFDYNLGTNAFVHHRHAKKDRGTITECYISAEIKQQSYVVDVMNRQEVDAVREKFSQSWYWENPYKHELGIIDLDTIEWYPKKTVLRRRAPYLPQNTRLSAALTYSPEEADGGDEADFEILNDDPITGDSQPALTEGAAPDFVPSGVPDGIRQRAEIAR